MDYLLDLLQLAGLAWLGWRSASRTDIAAAIARIPPPPGPVDLRALLRAQRAERRVLLAEVRHLRGASRTDIETAIASIPPPAPVDLSEISRSQRAERQALRAEVRHLREAIRTREGDAPQAPMMRLVEAISTPGRERLRARLAKRLQQGAQGA